MGHAASFSWRQGPTEGCTSTEYDAQRHAQHTRISKHLITTLRQIQLPSLSEAQTNTNLPIAKHAEQSMQNKVCSGAALAALLLDTGSNWSKVPWRQSCLVAMRWKLGPPAPIASYSSHNPNSLDKSCTKVYCTRTGGSHTCMLAVRKQPVAPKGPSHKATSLAAPLSAHSLAGGKQQPKDI